MCFYLGEGQMGSALMRSLQIPCFIKLIKRDVFLPRRGTNGIGTNGVTANLLFFDRGAFWVLPLTYFYLPKSARAHAHLFRQSVKMCCFCSRPISVVPICPQPRPCPGATTRISSRWTRSFCIRASGISRRVRPWPTPRARWRTRRCSEGGDDTVGNPRRAQIFQFDFFELILLLTLDTPFSIERLEPTVSQSAASSPPLKYY